MSTYEQAGVNIDLGDKCSQIAYEAAKKTFKSRKGLIGEPVTLEGGFTGALDFGEFYLVQNDDGVGTKVLIAQAINKYDTIGYDLLGTVADDCVCVGAEVISVSNTIDINKVDPKIIEPFIEGFKNACMEHKIIIPGGEIAELGSMVSGLVLNSTAVGIVEKEKFLTPKNINPGDKIIGLSSRGFRSNGFSLIRHILKNKFGENWPNEKYNDEKTWGEVTLTPSLIYHSCILEMLGRYKQPRQVEIKAIAHITGGGIPGNLKRILGNLGADLNNLPDPHEPMLKLQELGEVEDQEAYKIWNMGIGMILISNEFEKIKEICEKNNIQTQIIGEITDQPGIKLKSKGFFKKDEELNF